MIKINSIKAREILDSRGNPTIEVELKTRNGIVKSSVPSGASKGKYEAFELRDENKKRYNGKGVTKAIENINRIIAPLLQDKDILNQEKIDNLMISLDGTEDKSKIGANSILAVSLAVCRAGADFSRKPLYRYISSISSQKISIPTPCFNIINGGAHAGNDLDFQEFMIIPNKKNIKENIREASEFYHLLKEKIKKTYTSSAVNIGDEGGFAPPINNPEDALKLIFGIKKINLFIDVASTEFFNKGSYKIGIKSLKKEELVNYYLDLINKYSIIGLEDPFSEDDYEGWQILSSKIKTKNSKLLIIGDDLLVTNIKRMEVAKKNNYCNSMILKLNQIGTVTEGIMAAKKAKEYGWKIIVSHRSGETNDDFISDFAVGIGSDYIKSGAPVRGERVSKYNRLMEIEDEINEN
jgi:enolase